MDESIDLIRKKIVPDVMKVELADLVNETYNGFVNDNKNRFKKENFTLNQSSLVKAINQFAFDVLFLEIRRNHAPSEAKIAGCLAFRVHKHHVVQIVRDDANYMGNININAIVAVVAALKYLFKADTLDMLNPDIKELVYMLSERHINQETLALAFFYLSEWKKNL